MSGERGFALIETLVSLFLVTTIGIAVLIGLNTGTKALVVHDTRVTAKNLAETQMEYVKGLPYATSYEPASISSGFEGYVAEIDASPLEDSYIQKITVTIYYHENSVLTLENYKVK
jgi:type II secretory pathway pseudopilin PulG